MVPKIILTDIDGVWTDGGMYYDELGNEFKKFNTSDSAGVLFCRLLGIEVGIITGENTNIVKRRADKLNISTCFLGVKDKLSCVAKIIEGRYSWDEVGYIGDDLNDIHLLERVGYSACPTNSPSYIKSRVKYVMSKKGGEGVFREFVEQLLSDGGLLDGVVNLYLDSDKKYDQ